MSNLRSEYHLEQLARMGSMFGQPLTKIVGLPVDQDYNRKPETMRLPFEVQAFTVHTDTVTGINPVTVGNGNNKQVVVRYNLERGEPLDVPLGGVVDPDAKQQGIIRTRLLAKESGVCDEIFLSPASGAKTASAANQTQKNKLLAIAEEVKIALEALEAAEEANKAIIHQYS